MLTMKGLASSLTLLEALYRRLSLGTDNQLSCVGSGD